MPHSKPPLLMLTQRLPYPPIKGEKIRPLQLLRYMSQWYSVHLGCLIDDPQDWPHVETVRALCADLHVAPLNPQRAKILCLRGLLSQEPLSVAYFHNTGLADWVRQTMHQVRPRVQFVASSNMAPYVLGMPFHGMRIVDLADVDSEKWRAYAEKAGLPMRWVYRREWRTVAALEQRIARQADVAGFVSSGEAALFRHVAPHGRARVLAVSNGVDHVYFDPASHDAPLFDVTRPNFVFTGTMDYPPNEDAVSWFSQDILPQIRARHPGASFHIVGARPSRAVQALSSRPGVFVTGRVPDVRPYLAYATAAVAPLRIARGIQNKVLEAMAMARPVIATTGALDGINAEPGRDVIRADDESTFAEAACALIEQGGGAAIGRAARERILRDYDWPACLRPFGDLLAPAAPAPSPEPAPVL